MTRQETLDAIAETADQVGGTLSEKYCGRGMFGKSCLGIVCSDYIECIEQAASRGLRGAQFDNMGFDFIVYWPGVKSD